MVPDYPNRDQVELLKGIWPTVGAIVHPVALALESGAFPGGLLGGSMHRWPLTKNSPDLSDYKESGVGNAAASSSPLPPMAPSELPPPPHPISVAPPQSQGVVPVPERSSNATRTGFVKTRPSAARRARKPVIYLYPPSSLPKVTVALSLVFLDGVSTCVPHRRLLPCRAKTKPRNPLPEQSLWIPVARPSTRALVRRFLAYTGR